MMKILMEGPKFLHGDNQIKNKTYKKMFISAKDLEKKEKTDRRTNCISLSVTISLTGVLNYLLF